MRLWRSALTKCEKILAAGGRISPYRRYPPNSSGFSMGNPDTVHVPFIFRTPLKCVSARCRQALSPAFRGCSHRPGAGQAGHAHPGGRSRRHRGARSAARRSRFHRSHQRRGPARRGAPTLRDAVGSRPACPSPPGATPARPAPCPEFWGLREFDAFLLVVDGTPVGRRVQSRHFHAQPARRRARRDPARTGAGHLRRHVVRRRHSRGAQGRGREGALSRRRRVPTSDPGSLAADFATPFLEANGSRA